MACDTCEFLPSQKNFSARVIAKSYCQTGAIDDVHRTIGTLSDVERREEGKRIVEYIAKLKYEIQHDRALTYGKLQLWPCFLLIA